MIIALVVLGVFLLILVLPVSARVAFHGELRIQVRVLAIPFTVYPRKEKKKREARKAGRKRPAPKKTKKKDGLSSVGAMLKEDGVGATARYLSEMAALVKTAAVRVLRAITVRELKLRLTVGGEDAAQTAIRHGALCGAVFPALAALEGSMRVRRREVQVTPDFVYGESRANLDLRVSAMPLRLLCAAIGLMLGFVGYTLRESAPPG